MPSRTFDNRRFDARPDRIDLRDRIYQPKLISLPPAWPDPKCIKQYLPSASALVLDQGTEGACTGFGLAAMINYLQWRNCEYKPDGLKPVSPRMLYHMAQMYDEWAGEDYTGSSCRGAMKGWHRHGVCAESKWPYCDAHGKAVFVPPAQDWADDAAYRPLGAYFRIEKGSVSDLQSAILEVGAIYCSAEVHKGWFLKTTRNLKIIKPSSEMVGGHAFALVGYNAEGFIVQNSWGPDWGYHGFAVLSYEDWVGHGTDAWVAVLGAPMRASAAAPTTFSSKPLQESVAQLGLFGKAPGQGFRYKKAKSRPCGESEAYLHSLVLGNNGQPINRIVSTANAISAVEQVCFSRPKAWLETSSGTPARLAVYVHGGLNNEEASITRIRMMAPYFLENQIYPLFVSWKTGALESISGVISDSIREIFRSEPSMRDEGVLDKIRESLSEARDRSIEVACENLLVRPMWSEMKQNAEAAAQPGGGIWLLARHLLTLRKEFPNLEIHLVGHSAGAIVLGHLLSLLDAKTSASSLTLYAPACTLEFAIQRYGAAIDDGKISADRIHVDIMDDERERADTVGPYGKSLLFLVSRALERRHKTPLLGMAWAWTGQGRPEDEWSSDDISQTALKNWEARAKAISLLLHTKQREYVPTGATKIRLTHGSFDNDIDVLSATLERIRGGKLIAPVENLSY